MDALIVALTLALRRRKARKILCVFAVVGAADSEHIELVAKRVKGEE